MEKRLSLFQIDTGTEWRSGQRQSLFLCRELQKRGFPVVLVVQPGSPLHRKAFANNLDVRPVRMRSETDPLAVARLSLLLNRKKCRLVHFHDVQAVWLGSAAASLAHVPLRVLTRREDDPLREIDLSRRKYTKDIDRMIALSEDIKKMLVDGSINPRLIRVIPDGIDFEPYGTPGSSEYLRNELGFGREDHLVGVVACLKNHKQHMSLIKTASLLKDLAPRIRMIIIGDGSLEMDLIRQVSAEGVENLVFFLGFKENIHKILSSLDQFVIFSPIEGFRNILLDAMASRLPITAIREGRISDVIIHEKNGLLAPEKYPEKMADAIFRLREDRILAARLGEEGYRTIHNEYSAEARAGEVISLYERLARTKAVKLHV